MIVTIHSDNSISFGSIVTGYAVVQSVTGTQVLAWSNNGLPRPVDLGKSIAMPKNRYTLSTDAGAEEFKNDFLAIWALSTAGMRSKPVLDVLIEDARQRVGAWKARREGNIDDSIASAVYALDERYPAGWGLETFQSCLEMIEEGVSPSLAADEA
jgi:hypothetical protein